MKKYFHLILITLLFGNTPKDSYVLLISFDGFRADYLDWYDTPNFDRLAEQGVKADGMKPVFVSKTFPNHYSIATGMYIENHGLIGNYFYDEKLDEYFTLSDRSKVEDARFYGGEPIWVTAEKQGVKSASYFWAGSAAAVGGVRPGIWKEYDHDFPFPARIDSVAKWFSLPEEKRPHLIMLYFHEPGCDRASLRPGKPGNRSHGGFHGRHYGKNHVCNGITRYISKTEYNRCFGSRHGCYQSGEDNQFI